MTGTARPRVAFLVSTAVALTAWSVASSQAGEVDLALLRSEEAIRVVDTATGDVTARVPDGVPSPDGTVVVRAKRLGERTHLIAVDAATGERRWRRGVEGAWSVRLVSPDGQTVVLGSPATGDIYTPAARSRTALLVSGPLGDPRRYDLVGNYEPEALTLDGGSVFVISYLPPLDPDRYQVRKLDLDVGEVLDVFTPDAHLQEAMGGTARTQVWAPDGRRLYTLYTTAGDDGRTHAFVHVLDLVDAWAHCVLLPDGVGTDEDMVTMALAPKGSLYVADRAAGTVAEVDTEQLTVVRSAALAQLPFSQVSAVASADGRLFLAAGRRVDVVAPGNLEVTASWLLEADVVGLGLADGGAELVAVLRDARVLVLDPASGEELRSFRVDGGQPVDAVGSSSKRVPAPREAFDCAC